MYIARTRYVLTRANPCLTQVILPDGEDWFAQCKQITTYQNLIFVQISAIIYIERLGKSQGVILLAQDYEYTPLYYLAPCQVRYYDTDKKKFLGGIAYRDFVIDGGTGEVISISDIITRGTENGKHFDDVIIEKSWLDLSSQIANYN